MTQEIRNMPFGCNPPTAHTAPPAPVAQRSVDCVCWFYGSAIPRRAIGGVLLGLSGLHWCGFGE